MEELTGFQRDCLYVINDLGKPNGSEIQAELEEYYQSYIHAARLYPSLDDLAQQEVIEKGSYDQRTNCYTLTASGERVLEKHHAWKTQRYPAGRTEAE